MNESTCEYSREEICKTNIQAFNWVENIPREKWSRAFDGGKRLGHMTTNRIQSMNFVLKATCNLPITALVRSTYFRSGTLFWKRRHDWTKMLALGKVNTDNCIKGIENEIIKSYIHNVMQFDRQRFYFPV